MRVAPPVPPACDAGRQGGEAGEVAVVDRQVLDLLGRDRERSLARSAPGRAADSAVTVTVSVCAADLEGHRRDRDAVAAADLDAFARGSS